MLSLISTARRAISFLDARDRRRLQAIGIGNVLTAVLDAIGLLLLVPFLALLGQQSGNATQAARFSEWVIGLVDPDHALAIIAVAAAAFFLTKSVLSVVLLWIQTGVLNTAAAKLCDRILDAYVDAPWIEQQRQSPGSLVRTLSPLGAAYAAVNYVVGGIVTMTADLAVFAAVFAALMLVDPLLAIGVTAYMLLGGLAYVRLVKAPLARRGVLVQTETETASNLLMDIARGIRELTIRGSVRSFTRRYRTGARSVTGATRILNVAHFSTRYFLETLLMFGAVLVVFAATLANSTTALIGIGVLLAAGVRALPALSNLLIVTNQIRSYDAAVAVVEDALEIDGDRSQPITTPSSTHEMTEIQFEPDTRIAFQNVTYGYPSRPAPALSNATFEIVAGETIGVVGRSGAGKSTLVDLLLGLLAPDSGHISVAGEDLSTVITSWRSNIGYVPQEIFITNESLRANIVLDGDTEQVDAQALERCIRIAHLAELAASLPAGLDTKLGERGTELSGGQRQRVGIARALYHDPPILILDEATSALDSQTEAGITSAIAQLHGTKTTIVIAHRLSTVRSCDRILYLEEGRVAGLAPFDVLRVTHPSFAELAALGFEDAESGPADMVTRELTPESGM
jgi:ABC-type multidrug transport system fused ATPase/permease subunit